MKDLFLAEPDEIYRKSFESYVLSYANVGNGYYFEKYKPALEDFCGYVTGLHGAAAGTDTCEGGVPTSVFWLIDGEKVVGVVRIRHHEDVCAGHIGYDVSPFYRNRGYGTAILRLALRKANAMGLREVVLTCATDNAASRKIIERNGGQWQGTFFDEEDNDFKHRYSIALTSR